MEMPFLFLLQFLHKTLIVAINTRRILAQGVKQMLKQMRVLVVNNFVFC